MPFDGTGFALLEDLQKIEAVIDLVGTPGTWCKGTFRTRDGRYCLRGAIRAAGAEWLTPVVLDAINEVTGKNYHCIESFNDQATTTHQQIYAVLVRTREKIVAGGVRAGTHNRHFRALFGCWNSIRWWFLQYT